MRKKVGEYHHIAADGAAVYSERWHYAGDYRDGIAVVQASDGRSTHIDLDGRLIHERWFVDLDVFHKGFARARDEAGWCHVDFAGRAVYEHRFASVEPFYNGQARVERFDGSLEVINESGQTVVQLRPARRSEFAALSGDMVGFWRTQTIGTAVALTLPEALPSSIEDVADRCRITPDGAHRLLRALGELQLVTDRNGRWELTPRGAFLHRDHPLTLADAALEYARPFTRMWLELPEALSVNTEWSPPDVFGDVASDDERREGHHRMLRSYARHDYPLVAEALEIGDDDRVVDAGGGLGAIARLLLASRPSLSMTVLDRPEVVEIGRRENADSSVEWHAANLFDSWGLEADVVILARVLHDWSDTDARLILQRAREAVQTGGRVFIVEMLVSQDHCAGSLCDLHLLMATGGRERSAEDYARLLTAAGFQPAGIRHVAALPSIVMGVAR